MKCMVCLSTSPSRCMSWRCHDCFGDPVFCTHCVQQSHQQSPFHRVSRWDGKCFSPSSLSNAGLTLNLGHAGRLCPSYKRRIEGDVSLQTRNSNETNASGLQDVINNADCASPYRTCRGELTQPAESSTSAKKRTFSMIDISGEVCNPGMQAHYESQFWQSEQSWESRKVPKTIPNSRPTIQPSVPAATPGYAAGTAGGCGYEWHRAVLPAPHQHRWSAAPAGGVRTHASWRAGQH